MTGDKSTVLSRGSKEAAEVWRRLLRTANESRCSMGLELTALVACTQMLLYSDALLWTVSVEAMSFPNGLVPTPFGSSVANSRGLYC